MQELLPQLDAMDIVERYAWFPAGQDNSALGTSALFDNCQTPVVRYSEATEPHSDTRSP